MKARRPLPVMLDLACALPGAAAARGASGGVRWIDGGIGADGRPTIRAEAAAYPPWVATAARGSGAWRSGVDVRSVGDGAPRAAFERRLAGPWLFVDLPPGRHRVVGRHAEDDAPAQTVEIMVTLRSGADVGPERERPDVGNPFGPRR